MISSPRRSPLELCGPPRDSLLSQASAEPDEAQKTQGSRAARKTSGFVWASCRTPRRQPQGQIWACREIQAPSLVNSEWDVGLGFSKGPLGGAETLLWSPFSSQGTVSGQVPPLLPSLGWGLAFSKKPSGLHLPGPRGPSCVALPSCPSTGPFHC